MKNYALIIPYRNREEHLEILLEYLKKYENGIDIYIFEQNNDLLFNRSFLFNAIFEIEEQYDYYIFHDVDLIPDDPTINYCQDYLVPTHLSCFCEQFNYKLLDNKTVSDSEMFGGVVAMSRKHLYDISGYTELYEGWGYEDNDLFEKVKKYIGEFNRLPWKYKSLYHDRQHNMHRNLYNNSIIFEKGIRIHKPKSKKLYLQSHNNNVYHYLVDCVPMFPCITCHKTDTITLIEAFKNKKNVIVSDYYVDQEFQTFAYHCKKSLKYNNVIVLHWSDILLFVLDSLNYSNIKTYSKIKKPFSSFNYENFTFEQNFIYSPLPILTFKTDILDLDIIAYYDLNNDLKKAFSILNPLLIYNHYENQGRYENRKYFYSNDEQITLRNIIWKNNQEIKIFFNTWTLPRYNFKANFKNSLESFGLKLKEKFKTFIVSHPGGGGVEKYLNMIKSVYPNYVLLIPNSNKMDHVELHINNEINNEITYYHEINANQVYDEISKYKYSKVIINHLCIFSHQMLQIIKSIIDKSEMTVTILHDRMLLKRDKLRSLILKSSDKVICPSNYLKSQYEKTGIRSIMINHPDMIYPYKVGKQNRSSIIMCIGENKGSKEIIEFLNNTTQIIVHLGYTYIKHERLINLGKYSDDDVQSIITQHNPSYIWFPSKKPESYCYALSHAIISGYPIVAYNVGSMVERLKDRPSTLLLNVNERLQNIDKNFIDDNVYTITGNNISVEEYCINVFNNLT